MNAAYLHLLLNHIPLIGLLFGAGVLLFAIARRTDESVRVALGIFVVAALLAVPTFLSGEPAEEVVENVAGVAENAIEPHEDAAAWALGLTVLTGIAGLALLIVRRAAPISRGAALAVLLIALLAVVAMGRTAQLGGKIRHTELAATAASAGGEHDD